MIDEALSYYDFKEPDTFLIRHNENMTYQVMDGNQKYLLRIHKSAEGLDFSSLCGHLPRQVYIESEIELLLRLNENSAIQLQAPVNNKFGTYVTRLSSGYYATALTWIDGEALTNMVITNEVVYEIGKLIGQLHNSVVKLPYINRYSYDEFMIDRAMSEIEKAYEEKHIGERHHRYIWTYLLGLKEFIRKEKKNFIIVHADYSKSNLILHENQLIPIDFSLSGYSLPEMDLADVCCSLNDRTILPKLIEGYQSVNRYKPNELYISIYEALSIILYIAYHHSRFEQDEKAQRSLDRWTDAFFEPICKRMNLII